jgi:sarcosine oxidase
MRVVVIGAGVFGSWTALWLRRRGASVLLVDQYGPGNSLSSSGDESRVTRSGHGTDAHYARWARRSLEQWRALDPDLVVPTGVVWLVSGTGAFEADTLATLERLDIPVERLETDAVAHRWPQIGLDGVNWALHEPESGVLLARRAVAATVRRFVDEGGEVRLARARIGDGPAVEVEGEMVDSDAVVFAPGPWLPTLLGPVEGLELSVTRQDVIYLATPPGDTGFDAGRLPTWVEYDAAFYGLPSIEHRGFKVAPDWPGPEVDPDTLDRQLAEERVADARRYLARRFPALAGRPIAEGRVCQYELTPDSHFILDRHPGMSGTDAWIVGGGSGHGFKHGPVVGEYLSALVTGDAPAVAELAPPDDRFGVRHRTPGIGMRTGGSAPDR